MNANSDPQDIWKRNDPALPQLPATAEMCAMARQREWENIWMRGAGLSALTALAIAFAYNAWSLDQPWVRCGQGWMLIVMTVYLWSLIRDRTARRASDETCTGFLLRALGRKRDGFRAIRRVVLFIIPGILASWWGGGAALKARTMGLDPSSLYYRYLHSSGPIIATCVLLLVIWIAFGAAAKKASAELEALRRHVETA